MLHAVENHVLSPPLTKKFKAEVNIICPVNQKKRAPLCDQLKILQLNKLKITQIGSKSKDIVRASCK